jgi:hypothetical protein
MSESIAALITRVTGQVSGYLDLGAGKVAPFDQTFTSGLNEPMLLRPWCLRSFAWLT